MSQIMFIFRKNIPINVAKVITKPFQSLIVIFLKTDLPKINVAFTKRATTNAPNPANKA